MSPEDWRRAMDRHESDRYAHAPVLLDLHGEITDLQKLGWMIRGGVIVLATLAGAGLLTLVLRNTGVFG